MAYEGLALYNLNGNQPCQNPYAIVSASGSSSPPCPLFPGRAGTAGLYFVEHEYLNPLSLRPSTRTGSTPGTRHWSAPRPDSPSPGSGQRQHAPGATDSPVMPSEPQDKSTNG